MPKVTVGFVPRERFSVAHECLESILDCTHIPFNLLVVDCNTPRKYKERMERVTKGCNNVEYLTTEEYLSQGQSRNLLIERAHDDYLCLTENDVLVEEDWLSHLLSACEDSPGSVAVPHIMEGPEPLGPAHFDWRLYRIKEVKDGDGVKIDIVERTSWEDYEPGKFVLRREEFIETHCMLWDMMAFEKYGRFETETNTREEIDVSLRL